MNETRITQTIVSVHSWDVKITEKRALTQTIKPLWLQQKRAQNSLGFYTIVLMIAYSFCHAAIVARSYSLPYFRTIE
ncbi:hypothetical protein [Pontibacter burrus]|uniref:Uncharacterized protein n=1 Tax=Pontibacter burrus TaxID=2704466 RepID=A0A6B3M0F9_9BACT|nr:hypothetical protein [Pontibacter burrus]NEM99420.1 hypothetical protein [Pontibacter burrus]